MSQFVKQNAMYLRRCTFMQQSVIVSMTLGATDALDTLTETVSLCGIHDGMASIVLRVFQESFRRELSQGLIAWEDLTPSFLHKIDMSYRVYPLLHVDAYVHPCTLERASVGHEPIMKHGMIEISKTI